MYDLITKGIYIAAVFCVVILSVITYNRHPSYTRRARWLGIPIYVALFAATCGVLAIAYLSALPGGVLFGVCLAISFHLIFALYLVPAGLYWAWRNKVSGMPLVRSCARRKRPGTHPASQRVFSWKWVLLMGVLVNLYTYGIFAIFRARMTESFKLEFLKPEFDTPAFVILILLISAAAPFYEEVVFRLGLQNLIALFLRRHGISASWAIIVSAAVWAFGHTGLVAPVGTKELQIFGVGIVLGKVMQKIGLEGCIVVHLMLNLLSVLYAPTVVHV
jgi:membrane protease YdiL (CAAX protease family)